MSITSYLQSSPFSWMSGPRSAFSLTPDWQTEKGKHSPGTISTLQIESALWRVECILYRTTDSSTVFLQASMCSSLKRWLACSNQHQTLTIIFTQTWLALFTHTHTVQYVTCPRPNVHNSCWQGWFQRHLRDVSGRFECAMDISCKPSAEMILNLEVNYKNRAI